MLTMVTLLLLLHLVGLRTQLKLSITHQWPRLEKLYVLPVTETTFVLQMAVSELNLFTET